jgi:hypothetical protein
VETELLVGLWDSGPYDYGAMESSWLGFLPDGRGWSGWESASGGMEMTRPLSTNTYGGTSHSAIVEGE